MADAVFKIMTGIDWRKAEVAGVYHGSPDDVRDGFIHFSTGEQVAATLAKHFAHIKDDLVLLRVGVDGLGDALRWEEGRGGALFPHLYASLSTRAVEAVTAVVRNTAGTFVIPALG